VAVAENKDDDCDEFITSSIYDSIGRIKKAPVCKIVVDTQHVDEEELELVYENIDTALHEAFLEVPVLIYGISEKPSSIEYEHVECTEDISRLVSFAIEPFKSSAKATIASSVFKAASKAIVDIKGKVVLSHYLLKTPQKLKPMNLVFQLNVDGIDSKRVQYKSSKTRTRTDKILLNKTKIQCKYHEASVVTLCISERSFIGYDKVLGAATVDMMSKTVQSLTLKVPEGRKQHDTYADGTLVIAVE